MRLLAHNGAHVFALQGTGNVGGLVQVKHHKYPDAVKYDTLTFTRVLDERLAVMDSTAATLCRDNGLPIVVFDLNEPANIALIRVPSQGVMVRMRASETATDATCARKNQEIMEV